MGSVVEDSPARVDVQISRDRRLGEALQVVDGSCVIVFLFPWCMGDKVPIFTLGFSHYFTWDLLDVHGTRMGRKLGSSMHCGLQVCIW